MNYAGRHELSTIDWPGHASYVVFLRGCPMSCPHCHNEKIRTGERLVDFNDIAQEILAARRYVSALVISGGEPVMQPEVCLELLIWGHALGLKVGLETSGCRPIPEGFDRVFLDIKTSLESWLYNSYTGDNKAFDNVVQNLERLDPNVTEIRYVVHELDPPIIDPFSPIIDMGFSIRLLKGDQTSQDYFTNFQNSVISDLNLKLEKGVLKK